MTQFYDLWSNLDNMPSLPSLPPPPSEGPSLSELINYIGDRPPHTFHQHLTLFDCCSESQESIVPSKQHCTIAIYFSLLYILAIQVPETPQLTRQARPGPPATVATFSLLRVWQVSLAMARQESLSIVQGCVVPTTTPGTTTTLSSSDVIRITKDNQINVKIFPEIPWMHLIIKLNLSYRKSLN